MHIVDIKGVTKSYEGHSAVEDLSMQINEGSIFGLLGPNGAGKTTTIRMILNIIMPDEGSIELFGEPINEKAKNRIGYLPEERGLYRKMKIGDQLRFLAELKGMPPSISRMKIDEWLHRFALMEWKDKKADELSKGMQQKVQFIITVLHDPDLIILDEPFAGMDPVNLDILKDVILEFKQKGKTIILSTHQMEQAEKMCDNICLINKSKKVLDGPLKSIKEQYGKNTVIIEYFGDASFLDDCKDMILKMNRYNNFVELTLKENADPQKLLEIAFKHVSISRFQIMEPSLHDIFVEIVA